MEAWVYVVLAILVPLVPAAALTLVCRTEAERGEEKLLPRWARARSLMVVALGGGDAVSLIPPAPSTRPGAESTRELVSGPRASVPKVRSVG